MAQETVSRAEMKALHVGQTRIFTLKHPKKLRSVYNNGKAFAKEERLDFDIKLDFDSCSVSITRLM